MTDSTRFIESYVHAGAIGVLIELGISDSTARRSESFTQLAKDLAMHIAAMAPASVEALLDQPAVADIGVSVNELVARTASDLHVEIAVLRFVRWVASPQEPLEPEPPRSAAVIRDLRAAG